ncbi:hypothetical protein HMPREF0591_1647 [Mycobacterium parascrofulaceum ATCC BAA-614]|uniref:Uncharacterized protein n=1 Tax=Mycobacterium parascrofulaceum ATCC BAA-614 TaxID=525368 RepID=D5P653_9MYCO|nr:hypothetical protein HMPREF0591_1647 [Mycobacterium parascrofulaceum ATCC BAA-614]
MASLVDVLTAAAKIADRHWNRASRATSTTASGNVAPCGHGGAVHLLVAALRCAALPPATMLCDFNNEANPLSVRALFDGAIAALKHGVTTGHVA